MPAADANKRERSRNNKNKGETSMTAIAFDTAPRFSTLRVRLQGFLATIANALDAYAAHRMENAVPDYELRRAERTIGRYRRLMEKPASAKPARRATRRRAAQVKG
jgi:hypothetical protein